MSSGLLLTIHPNWDPRTDSCVDCGATRHEFGDNLASACKKVTGPNRLAIIAVRRERRQHETDLMGLRSQLSGAENAIVRLSQEIREKEHQLRELEASLKALEQG